MSRDSSGTYTLASGNPVVTGNTISSTWANNTLADLKTEMTDSLSRSGKGGMLETLTGAKGATFTQSTTNSTCATFTGNGSGAGVTATGGATGNGVTAVGVATGHGVNATGGNSANAHGVVGTAGSGASASGLKGVAANSANGSGVWGQSNHANVNGLYGQTLTGTGANVAAVYADSTTSGGYALLASGDQAGTPARAAFRLVPQQGQPATGQVGDVYVTLAGVLKICTAAGTPGTWVSVGSQ